MGRLEGKVAIITGAGSGLGREAAQLFAAEGASVVAMDVLGDRAEATVKLLEDLDRPAVAVEADTTVEADVARTVETALSTLESSTSCGPTPASSPAAASPP